MDRNGLRKRYNRHILLIYIVLILRFEIVSKTTFDHLFIKMSTNAVVYHAVIAGFAITPPEVTFATVAMVSWMIIAIQVSNQISLLNGSCELLLKNVEQSIQVDLFLLRCTDTSLSLSILQTQMNVQHLKPVRMGGPV